MDNQSHTTETIPLTSRSPKYYNSYTTQDLFTQTFKIFPPTNIPLLVSSHSDSAFSKHEKCFSFKPNRFKRQDKHGI